MECFSQQGCMEYANVAINAANLQTNLDQLSVMRREVDSGDELLSCVEEMRDLLKEVLVELRRHS